jgi:hypothetical protein
VKPLAVFAPVAKPGMFCNSDWLFDDFNLLNHTAGVWDEFKNAAALRASVKRVGFAMIDLVGRKRRSFVLGMAGLTADFALRIVFGFSRRLGNIRRRRLGGIRRILRKLSDLIRQQSHLFGQFGNLFFKFRDTLNVKLFFFGSHVSSLKHLLQILSDNCGVRLEKNSEKPP